MERFVANVVQFLRNIPLSSKLYTPHNSKITTANNIKEIAPPDPALSIVQYFGD